jgi:hypothetical protein
MLLLPCSAYPFDLGLMEIHFFFQVGLLGGVLFLLFAAATLFGVF